MTFIIAECGVNWRDLVDADDMIREAAKAGADAVKFQAYRVTDFTISDYQPEIIGQLAKIQLDESTIRYLYWRCQQHGIEFMCTPFYPEAVAMLNPYVKRWKVRFNDRMNGGIVDKCLATNKEILISCNESYPQWYDEKHQVKYLYCCPEYPPKTYPDLFTLGLKKEDFDGYSCHIPYPNLISQFMECVKWKYLEVHVRLDKYEPHYCPIDCAVSITMSELAELCRRLKG